MMLSSWQVQLLGGLCARSGDQEFTRFRSQRTGALFAYLAYHTDRAQPREELIERFWPDADREAGRTSLRTALSSLRHQLEPPSIAAGSVLVADRVNVRLRSEAIHTDVNVFETSLQAVGRAQERETKLAGLQAAVAAYAGPLLPGYYEDWLLVERERLSVAYQQALCQLAAALQQSGRVEQAIAPALRAVAQDALNEEAHYLLMQLYVANNQPAAALKQYAQLERTLRAELTAAPASHIQSLYKSLQNGTEPQGAEAAASLPSLPPPNTRFRSHGGASVKESSCHAPSDSRFTPGCSSVEMSSLTPPASSAAPPVRLPLLFTRFFGRESEREQLVEWLLAARNESDAQSARDKNRVFTIAGMGGIGKTRFAVEVGRAAAMQGIGGVTFVPLAEVSRPEQILRAIAGALELPPAGEEAAAAQVTQALQATPMLLVLDNFEQLLNEGDGDEDVAEQAALAGNPLALTLLARLCEQAPSLLLLITSRQRLNLAGEREFPLPPLLVPQHPGTVERLLEFASVRLFVDRAQTARPDFQITPRNSGDIAALCAAMEGMPLALEMMAAWAQMLTPAQMRQRLTRRMELLRSRLHGIPARHRGLRACIEWSYSLLPAELKKLYACLSVFRGGWTVEAAEAVSQDTDILTHLTQLRERSLISTEEVLQAGETTMRYRMLETLREYASDRLLEMPDTNAPGRQAQYFKELVLEAEREMRGEGEARWLAVLETEHNNICASLDWYLQFAVQDSRDNKESGSKNSGENGSREDADMRRRDMQETTATQTGRPQVQELYKMISGLVRFWYLRSHVQEGRQYAEALLARPAPQNLTEERANLLNAAGKLARYVCDFTASRDHFEQSLQLYRCLGHQRGIAGVLNNLGNLLTDTGEIEAGISLYQEALALNRELGDLAREATNLYNLGLVARHKQEYGQAAEWLEQSLHIHRRLKAPSAIANSLLALSITCHYLDNPQVARAYVKQAEAIYQDTGSQWGIMDCLNTLGNLDLKAGMIQSALENYRQAFQLVREINDQKLFLNVLGNMASLFARTTRPYLAAVLIGSRSVLQRALNIPKLSKDAEDEAEDIALVKAAVGEEGYQAYYAQGCAMDAEEVIQYALENSPV